MGMTLPFSRIASRTGFRSHSIIKNSVYAGTVLLRCQGLPPSSVECVPRLLELRTDGFASKARGDGGFSMELLKSLRSQSGAPIVDCKKALQHADNDIPAALRWLREHGAAKASSKLQGREASEGLVGLTVSDDGKSACLVKLASETDFAGRSSMCVDLVLTVAEAASSSSNVVGQLEGDAVLNTKCIRADGKTIKDLLDEAIVAIRENLSLPTVIRLEAKAAAGGILVGYVHNRVDSSRTAGTAAAVVEVAPLEGKDVPTNILLATGKKLAMHVVAARPQYLRPDDVPANEVKKEKEILTKQAEEDSSDKPPEIVEKIVLGRMRKFYEEVCLTEQPHMIEEKNPKVGKVLNDQGIAVKQFVSLSIT